MFVHLTSAYRRSIQDGDHRAAAAIRRQIKHEGNLSDDQVDQLIRRNNLRFLKRLWGPNLHTQGNLTILEAVEPINSLASIPPIFMAATKANGLQVWLGEGAVPDFPPFASLKNQRVFPSDPNSPLWNDVWGVHQAPNLAVGYQAGLTQMGGTSVQHEFGHALDAAWGISTDQDLLDFWTRLGTKLGAANDGYYNAPAPAGPREFFAESFGLYLRTTKVSFIQLFGEEDFWSYLNDLRST